MEENKYSRREFIRRSTGVIAGLALVSPLLHLSCTEKQTPFNEGTTEITAIVSIVRIREGKVERAVEEAIDWLGGIHSVTEGKQRIMLKPNLVAD
jgi:hypothetical protein